MSGPGFELPTAVVNVSTVRRNRYLSHNKKKCLTIRCLCVLPKEVSYIQCS